MRRMLKLRTWTFRGTTAAEASLVLLAATVVVPVFLFVGASWLTYNDVREQAEERMARTLDLLYVNVATTFETGYLVAANVAEIVDDFSNEAIRTNEQRLHDRLRRLVEPLRQIQNVFVIDEQGAPLVSARNFPLPTGLIAADRSYFIAHRDRAERRHISEPMRGRVNDGYFFQYSERRETPDGRFNGVVAVSISPRYFVERFAEAADIDLFTAALVKSDGEVLARYPAEAETHRLASDSGFMKAIAASPESGAYATPASSFDGLRRIVMYRKLADLPLYVVHGYGEETVTRTWLRRMASHLVFGLPATIALFILALVASRRAIRQDEALEQLRTEQIRRATAEESLRQSQKMTAVGQLTAGIAHDFNNLLTGIGGAIEMVGRRVPQPTPDVMRFLDLARTGVSRAASLTQRMLAFARQQPLQIEAIDANRIVTGMSELMRRTLGEKVKIETVLAGGLWRAKADVAQLESAILNLAINARDAMQDGGTLTIETANSYLDDAYAAANAEVVPGQYVMIAVSDTGTGMPPETIARAFEPFFTTKERGQGTGLGLSMSFGYVKQVGGHLKIYSEVGQGTTVKMYLPREMSEAVADVESQPLAPEAGTGTVVLVVEDDPIVREFAMAACREIGCVVYQAADGEEALRVLAAHDDIQLLFTDVGLPGGLNGRQIASLATERRPSLKVLFTTGYTANAIVHHGVLDAGVNFIGKPFSVSALAAKMKSMGL